MAKFVHPNIVRVRDFFTANNTGYLVMDYYDGISLGDHLVTRGGKLEVDEALRIVVPILEGLEAVHAQGFLHRDIKPNTIVALTVGIVMIIGAVVFFQYPSPESRLQGNAPIVSERVQGPRKQVQPPASSADRQLTTERSTHCISGYFRGRRISRGLKRQTRPRAHCNG